MHGIVSVFLMPVFWRIASPSVSFPELVLIILQLWCSQRHHRCQLSSPARVWGAVCRVVCHVTGADTDHSSGVGQGRDQRFIIAFDGESFILKLPTLSRPSSQLQTQGSSCNVSSEHHLSIRVASAGVRCLETLRQFLLRGWFIVTSWERFTDQWRRSKDSLWPMGSEQEKLAASGRAAAGQSEVRGPGVRWPPAQYSSALSLLFTFILLNNKMSEWWKNCKITLFLCGGHYFECKYELWWVNKFKRRRKE